MGHAAPKPLAFPDAEGPVLPEGNNHPRREFFWARGAGIRRGVRPWHARRGRPRNLGGPRLSSTKPRLRGEPVTRLRRTTRWRAHVSSAAEAQKKRPQRGRPPARGTGAVAKGGRESEGCIRAVTSGNGMPPRTRPSKGGPCWCELQEGTMPNALTLADMSPGLLEVVEKHESHQRKSRMVEISLSGSGEGLGWATAQPTLQRYFCSGGCGSAPRMVKIIMRPRVRSISGAPQVVHSTESCRHSRLPGWIAEKAGRCPSPDDCAPDDNGLHTR
jgi:hypothetical protein